MDNKVLRDLQSQLDSNIDKAKEFAEKNTKRNSLGQVVLRIDDEWRRDDEDE